MIPRVLSIAGTDPTGGAGIQADLKSIAAAGGYGMSVVTALVSQNTRGVRSVHTPPTDFLVDQLDAVFSDVTVDAVKIGMLGDADTVAVVSTTLAERELPGPVVLDPVMVASSGDRLLNADAEQAVRDLVAQADVVTPNLDELGILTGNPSATDLETALAQAKELAAGSDVIVIAKGGHLTGSAADNAAVYPDGRVHRVPSPRLDTTNTHGTGCSLSSALATRLAAGHDVDSALEWSSRWLHEAIREAGELHVGEGNGPVDHGYRGRRQAAAASTVPWPHLTGVTPTAPAPTPHLAPAGPHTARLWELTGEVWGEIMDLPFIRGLRDGSLRDADFRFYLDQDAQYLSRYARALATLAATAPDHESQVGWASASTDCVVVEAELHRTWLGGHDMGYAAPSRVTMAYTDFLVTSVTLEDYVVGVAAILPCFWLYAEIGLDLVDDNHADHPYTAWLSTYADQEFVDGATLAIARMEKALESATDQQREAATRAYLTACVYEREFFDQADWAW